MSEPTVIDTEHEEAEATELTLEERVRDLEGMAKIILEGQKVFVSYFVEAMEAIKEISEESSEEQNYL